MGRSVSYASGAEWVLYTEVGEDEDSYSDFVADLSSELRAAFPSMSEPWVTKWLGREDRVVCENSHCYIGISTYFGLASVWCVLKDVDNDRYGIALHWAESVEDKVAAMLPGRLVKIATASNGESMYKAAA